MMRDFEAPTRHRCVECCIRRDADLCVRCEVCRDPICLGCADGNGGKVCSACRSETTVEDLLLAGGIG